MSLPAYSDVPLAVPYELLTLPRTILDPLLTGSDRVLPLLGPVLCLFAGFLLFQQLLRWLEGPLGWESGRRRAREPFKRSVKAYDALGVISGEEFVVNARGVELFCKHWLPKGSAPSAVVFYCHGYGDTCTYTWEDTAVALARQGLAVVSMDYEGHGMSAGLHCFIRNFKHLADDVILVSSIMRGRPAFAHLPFFLYGESMGGAVAVQVHRQQPKAWAGAVLVAPMCKISEEMIPPPAVVAFLKLLTKVVPTWKLVPTKDILDVGFKDPEKRERVRRNPVGYVGKPRLLTALNLVLTTEEIGSHLHEVCLPLLVLHGAADVVTSPELSAELVAKASSADKTLKVYQGAWHGLTAGEPDEVASQVVADIVAWLRQRSNVDVLQQDLAVSQMPGKCRLPAEARNPLAMPSA